MRFGTDDVDMSEVLISKMILGYEMLVWIKRSEHHDGVVFWSTTGWFGDQYRSAQFDSTVPGDARKQAFNKAREWLGKDVAGHGKGN